MGNDVAKTVQRWPIITRDPSSSKFNRKGGSDRLHRHEGAGFIGFAKITAIVMCCSESDG